MPILFIGIGVLALWLLWPRKSFALVTTGAIALDPPDLKTATIDNLTRGERNNNPGNIADNPANAWLGQIGSDGTYCIFDTSAHGIRAISHTLQAYQRKGEAQTIKAMIYRYSSSDQAAYARNVAAALGLAETDSPDLTDADTLVTMVTAIIKQENGRVNYDMALITGATQLA